VKAHFFCKASDLNELVGFGPGYGLPEFHGGSLLSVWNNVATDRMESGAGA
jgi:hypothetical protein